MSRDDIKDILYLTVCLMLVIILIGIPTGYLIARIIGLLFFNDSLDLHCIGFFFSGAALSLGPVASLILGKIKIRRAP